MYGGCIRLAEAEEERLLKGLSDMCSESCQTSKIALCKLNSRLSAFGERSTSKQVHFAKSIHEKLESISVSKLRNVLVSLNLLRNSRRI